MPTNISAHYTGGFFGFTGIIVFLKVSLHLVVHELYCLRCTEDDEDLEGHLASLRSLRQQFSGTTRNLIRTLITDLRTLRMNTNVVGKFAKFMIHILQKTIC